MCSALPIGWTKMDIPLNKKIPVLCNSFDDPIFIFLERQFLTVSSELYLELVNCLIKGSFIYVDPLAGTCYTDRL